MASKHKFLPNVGQVLLATLAFTSVGSGLRAAETRYYVNDHLATTVGIADAAGEIAALEADAFGSPLAAGEAPNRYTGKPYDEDLGAFVFPFRNYRAEEGRWMTADPSGFPDGMNSRIYVRNALCQIDPLGLIIQVVGSQLMYDTALDYIRSDPTGNSVWNQLNDSSSVYTIDVSGNHDRPRFIDNSRTIIWNPLLGVEDSSNGARISPATVLLHEMGHAAGYDADPAGYANRTNTPDANYKNAEERRVTTEIENPFAQRKGEGTRQSHSGNYTYPSGITQIE